MTAPVCGRSESKYRTPTDRNNGIIDTACLAIFAENKYDGSLSFPTLRLSGAVFRERRDKWRRARMI